MFLTARLDLARAVLAAGDRDKAIWWLETAERCLGDIPGAVKTLRAERDRIRRTPRWESSARNSTLEAMEVMEHALDHPDGR